MRWLQIDQVLFVVIFSMFSLGCLQPSTDDTTTRTESSRGDSQPDQQDDINSDSPSPSPSEPTEESSGDSSEEEVTEPSPPPVASEPDYDGVYESSHFACYNPSTYERTYYAELTESSSQNTKTISNNGGSFVESVVGDGGCTSNLTLNSEFLWSIRGDIELGLIPIDGLQVVDSAPCNYEYAYEEIDPDGPPNNITLSGSMYSQVYPSGIFVLQYGYIEDPKQLLLRSSTKPPGHAGDDCYGVSTLVSE